MAGDNEEANSQRLQSSFGTSSSSFPKQQQQQQSFVMNQTNVPQLSIPQFRAPIRQNSPNAGISLQIPPISPYSQIPVNHQQTGMQNFSTSHGPSHGRSLSQHSFFALDSLPPLSPSPYNRELHSNSISDQVSADVSMEERNGNSHSLLSPSTFGRGNSLRIGESLPPRKAHRRSNSDIPFGFMPVLQSSPSFLPSISPVVAGENQGTQPIQLVKKESCWEKGVETSHAEGIGERKPEGEVVDDLFSTYMNLDNIDAFNSSGTGEKLRNENREDLDSRANDTKTNGGDSSDNETTSGSVDESGSSSQKQGKREGLKRNVGGDIAPTTRHYRSVSMDSFMGKINFGDESPKMPPSSGNIPGQSSPTNSMVGNAFSMEFSSGEFTGAELKKIMANGKLSEIALSDPKRAKRILANRQSAARSKERKMRYIAELEHKVQALQTEATTLSAQFTMLQRDSVGLTTQNNELKFRLHAMEQQTQLRDALNETLTAEVHRLKITTAELSGDKFQQLSISPHLFQLRQQQQQTMHQMQQHQHQSSGNTTPSNSESNR